MEMKKTSPLKPPQRLGRRSSFGFSTLPKSLMSTPLIPRSSKIIGRRYSSRIVTLTPKVSTNDKSSLTAKVPNINIGDEGVKNDLEKILDHSISEAHVTLDVSGTDWKGASWLEKRTKPQRKRKIGWSEEDQTVIDKLNETRKKICLGLSSISSTAFETIKESEEYEEEELKNENDYGEDSSSVQVIEDETLVDSASVEVIEEDTLVNDAHKADETSSPKGEKAQITENKNGKLGVDKDGEGTIVLDDTPEPSDNTDIEDGEIVDDTQDESIIGRHPNFSPEKLKTKFTVNIPPKMVIPSSKIHRTGLLPTPGGPSFNPSKMVIPTSNIHHPGLLPTPSFNPSKMVIPTSNIHRPGLRPIVIDGSNVAFAHAKSKPLQKNQNGSEFSCRGIKLVVEYFERRGHEDIVAFVPAFRKKMGKSQETHLLEELERKGVLAFTPSREVAGQFIASHDDRFILEYATKHGGVVVTRDNFRDHFDEVPEWRDTIQRRLLQPTFVRGELMFPDDPMGKDGASLEKFLKF